VVRQRDWQSPYVAILRFFTISICRKSGWRYVAPASFYRASLVSVLFRSLEDDLNILINVYIALAFIGVFPKAFLDSSLYTRAERFWLFSFF